MFYRFFPVFFLIDAEIAVLWFGATRVEEVHPICRYGFRFWRLFQIVGQTVLDTKKSDTKKSDCENHNRLIQRAVDED